MKTHTEKLTFDETIKLESGSTLSGFELMIETYGELNQSKDNAVLVCHAFSGNHHAAGTKTEGGKPGWWDQIIGMTRPLIHLNILLYLLIIWVGVMDRLVLFRFPQKPIKCMEHLFLKFQSRTGLMHKKLY